MKKITLVFLALCFGALRVIAETPARVTAEDTKIEALLTYIGSQAKVSFIRNGSEYDSSTAVKFLRGKWDRQRASIGSAREFIDKIASRSSTTGLVYQIRLADGREVDCGLFLSARLAELEKK